MGFGRYFASPLAAGLALAAVFATAQTSCGPVAAKGPQYAPQASPTAGGPGDTLLGDDVTGTTPSRPNVEPKILELKASGEAVYGKRFPITLAVKDDDKDEKITVTFSLKNGNEALKSDPISAVPSGIAFEIDVPLEVETQDVTGVITVTDSLGAKAVKEFPIHIRGKSALKKAADAQCAKDQPDLVRLGCSVGGVLIK